MRLHRLGMTEVLLLAHLSAERAVVTPYDEFLKKEHAKMLEEQAKDPAAHLRGIPPEYLNARELDLVATYPKKEGQSATESGDEIAEALRDRGLP